MTTSARGVLLLGGGHVRVDAGSTLTVSAVGDDCTYHISGYQIQVGSPYVSLTGAVASNSIQDVATIPSGKTFVLKSIIVGGTQPETCDLYADGTLIVDGNLRAMSAEGAMNTAFTNGNIRIPILENQTISLENTSVSSLCNYYLEGSYVQ
jgi:hypothetical protein